MVRPATTRLSTQAASELLDLCHTRSAWSAAEEGRRWDSEEGIMEAADVAAVVGKVAERLLDAEDDDDDSHEGITEESVAEVMRWLELEIKLAAGPVVAQPSPTRFVMASGNDESCGPALCGSASTVMASVDGWVGVPVPPTVPWPWTPPEAAADNEHYEDDSDDAWALQLLTDGPGAEMLCGSQ